MLELSPSFFAVTIPVVIFAGISKGGFGSGASFAAAALLALVLEPGVALGVMLPILMLIDLVTLRPYWRGWSWPDARLMILGGVPGVALGAILYQFASQDVLRVMLGFMAVGFVAWQLVQAAGMVQARQTRLPPSAGLCAGLAAGFTSFVSHAGGPPAAIYLLSQGLTKTTYQATTVLVFWSINVLKAIPYGFLGLFTAQTLHADVVLAPFAMFGAWLGVKAHRLVPERLFFSVTYVLLVVTGLKLIYDGLT